MNSEHDLHIRKLHYSLVVSERFSFSAPPPVEFETADASFRLAEGHLICVMKINTSSDAEAIEVVEPALRSWEVVSDLNGNQGAFRFKYEGAEIVDSSDLESGDLRIHVLGVGRLALVGNATELHVTLNAYPEQPGEFRLNPDAKSMWHRFEGYLQGSEPLLSMAYFCLTLVETIAGGRAKAASSFAVDVEVLNKIGELTSTHGDRTIARKASAGSPLTGYEASWLVAAVKELIFRVGDERNPSTLPKITFASLPPLS